MSTYFDPTEVRPRRSRAARVILVVLGSMFVALGVLGVFLPLVPATPFLLLAAACYARASARFYGWLVNNRLLGPIIREWRLYRSIPRSAKRTAVVMIVLSFGTSIFFFVEKLWLRVALALGACTAVASILRFPTRDPDPEADTVRVPEAS